jgi:hypothetical protein
VDKNLRKDDDKLSHQSSSSRRRLRIARQDAVMQSPFFVFVSAPIVPSIQNIRRPCHSTRRQSACPRTPRDRQAPSRSDYRPSVERPQVADMLATRFLLTRVRFCPLSSSNSSVRSFIRLSVCLSVVAYALRHVIDRRASAAEESSSLRTVEDPVVGWRWGGGFGSSRVRQGRTSLDRLTTVYAKFQ